MDLNDTPPQQVFRREVREFLAAELPRELSHKVRHRLRLGKEDTVLWQRILATEQARSMAIVAAVKVQSPDAAERRRMVSSAKALVGQSARYVGQQAVQLHGGMGVTDELAAAHLFKRLTAINLTFGDADHHLALVSDGLLVA
jgi:hypothetical protein